MTKKARAGQKDFRQTEAVAIEDLKPHPRNYRKHPEDQLQHIGESLKQHGFYRNVVVAKDGTILAGHGVVEAAKKIGLDRVPVFRLDLAPGDPRALKVLASDNELGRFAEIDEAALGEILKDVLTSDVVGLLGTGYDEETLAGLLQDHQQPISRGAGEAADGENHIDHSAEWQGMPEFVQNDETPKRQIIVNFKSEEDVAAFAALVGQNITDKTRSIWHPKAEIDRLMDKRYRRK